MTAPIVRLRDRDREMPLTITAITPPNPKPIPANVGDAYNPSLARTDSLAKLGQSTIDENSHRQQIVVLATESLRVQ